MKLFNTMSRHIEDLTPLHENTVSLYTCGPTVYDQLHLGNWVAFIRWDTLARILKYKGYGVNWIMNITDVGHLVSDADDGEDKLEKGARREGKTAWEVAELYTKSFLHGLNDLNISISRQHLPKATDHIKEQIALIERLEKRNFIYKIDDGVYFDTSKVDNYGKLARLKVDELKAGARVSFNQQKRNVTDFALWKFSPKDSKRDMEWESPWGKGFPGWHLECSAMAMKYLGETIDIHAGGIDHIPVHHTNEIAQSESATGKPFANIWLHSNFLTVDGSKISKSLNNGINLKDIKSKGFSPLDFRLFVLQSHYRSEANFTWEGLSAAKSRLQSLRAMADLRWQPNPEGAKDSSLFDVKKLVGFLENDLNTPEALAYLSHVDGVISDGLISEEAMPAFNELLSTIDDLFGLKLNEGDDITPEQKNLIKTREAMRKEQNWQATDEIRNELHNQGLNVRDTSKGSVWSRV